MSNDLTERLPNGTNPTMETILREMRAGFDEMRAGFATVNARLDSLESRVESLDRTLVQFQRDTLDRHMRLDERLERVEGRA